MQTKSDTTPNPSHSARWLTYDLDRDVTRVLHYHSLPILLIIEDDSTALDIYTLAERKHGEVFHVGLEEIVALCDAFTERIERQLGAWYWNPDAVLVVPVKHLR